MPFFCFKRTSSPRFDTFKKLKIFHVQVWARFFSFLNLAILILPHLFKFKNLGGLVQNSSLVLCTHYTLLYSWDKSLWEQSNFRMDLHSTSHLQIIGFGMSWQPLVASTAIAIVLPLRPSNDTQELLCKTTHTPLCRQTYARSANTWKHCPNIK